MELHETATSPTFGTVPMEPMRNSVRVGYSCGEHDYENSGLHHKHFRGDFIDADGWAGDGTWPVNGYYLTAAQKLQPVWLEIPAEEGPERDAVLAAAWHAVGLA